MKAIECDVCGEYEDVSPFWHNHRSPIQIFARRLRPNEKQQEKGEELPEVAIDLCHKCYEAFLCRELKQRLKALREESELVKGAMEGISNLRREVNSVILEVGKLKDIVKRKVRQK